jgi:hypothetical protein
MRERSTWNRNKIASNLKRIAEDPRAMNQDHLQQQPAADKYDIGGPSDFAEDVASPAKSWKAEYGTDGNTTRNEIGMPEFRKDTFTKNDKSPGESPKRATLDVETIEKRAELTTDIARLMFKGASEDVIEDQALSLMDLSDGALRNMYQRLAAQQGDDEDSDEEEEGQSKEAQGQDDDEEEGDDAKGGQQASKKAQGQQEQKTQAQQQDKDKEGQQQDKDQQASKKASKKASQQQKTQAQEEEESESEQSKEAKGSVPPEFLEQQKKNKGDDEEEGQDKEASSMVKSAAASLLAFPAGTARNEAAKVLLLPIYKHLASKTACMDAQGQQQLLGQVQQMVQQAMQQQLAQQQQQVAQGQQQQVAQGQQPQQVAQQQLLSDEELVDQMLLDQGQEGQLFLAEESIEMVTPHMDVVGEVELTDHDQHVLSQVFASSELNDALEARALQGHSASAEPFFPAPAAPAQTRTASTRTVGTRPTAGVSTLGGVSAGGAGASGAEEISKLSSMWNSAPDVSKAF